MSFAVTKQSVIDQTQTVTRRKGWNFLKAGDLLWAVEKSIGLKKGETRNRLAMLKVVSVTQVVLNDYTVLTKDEVVREGFPKLEPWAFVFTYCVEMGGDPDQELNRIEFVYVPLEKWDEEIRGEQDRAKKRADTIKVPPRLKQLWEQQKLLRRKPPAPPRKKRGNSRRLSNMAKLKLLREAMARQIHYWNTGVNPRSAMDEAERVYAACKPSAENPCDLRSHGKRPRRTS